MVRPSRTAAVKDGPFLGPPEGFVLDGREHDGRLVCVGIDRVAGCRRSYSTGERYPIEEWRRRRL
jgi:hypothetical protein